MWRMFGCCHNVNVSYCVFDKNVSNASVEHREEGAALHACTRGLFLGEGL